MRKYLLFLLVLSILSCKDNTGKEQTAPLAQSDKSPELKESISRGASIYSNFCASCHLSGGQGIEGVFPPLNKSNWLTEKRKETIHAVKYGLNGLIEVNGVEYDNLMPELGLTDQETADVLNYIFHSWENSVKEPVSAEEVSAIAK
ncbi:c-type cytochrome [Salinimicrobium gaetbulicola]|uniref:C-type cytochrome n=1 Tax=Salinimicrobium gaetbulicola TaxID=999702 RepID=A0ABW3IDH1_9FLAO